MFLKQSFWFQGDDKPEDGSSKLMSSSAPSGGEKQLVFDDVLRMAGEFGPYQIVLYIILGIVGFPAGKICYHISYHTHRICRT